MKKQYVLFWYGSGPGPVAERRKYYLQEGRDNTTFTGGAPETDHALRFDSIPELLEHLVLVSRSGSGFSPKGFHIGVLEQKEVVTVTEELSVLD